MSERYEYCFQVLNKTVGRDGVVDDEYWADVPMYPPGLGNDAIVISKYEVWKAYLDYLRVVHPEDKYRLTATTITTTTEILDV